MSYYTGSASYTMTWTQGRHLATMSGNGQSLSFTYNADGIRTSKKVDGVTHYYHLAGTQILSEEWTDANDVQHLIIYHYDTNDQPVGMSYRNSTDYEGTYDSFLFVKNLQGDIIKVLDDEGDLLVSYTYDAWGNPTSTTYSNGGAATPVVYNPFRYRGYYYDSELGFYYLNSRYYDPAICRFINSDGYVDTGIGFVGYNMFVYCNNAPINAIDSLGTVTKAVSIGLDLTALFGFCFSVGFSYDHHGNIAFSYSYAHNHDDTVYVGGLDAGISISKQTTLLDSVDDLKGAFGYVGVSGGYLGDFGADAVFLPDNYEGKGIGGSPWVGYQVSVGLGIGADAHIMQTQTKQTESFNPFKAISKAANWIKSRFVKEDR